MNLTLDLPTNVIFVVNIIVRPVRQTLIKPSNIAGMTEFESCPTCEIIADLLVRRRTLLHKIQTFDVDFKQTKLAILDREFQPGCISPKAFQSRSKASNLVQEKPVSPVIGFRETRLMYVSHQYSAREKN